MAVITSDPFLLGDNSFVTKTDGNTSVVTRISKGKALTETEIVPDAGNYYTFIYNAKTPGVFDEFPLVAVTFVDRWGFQGLNFHWGSSRNYTWREIIGNLHVIQNDEIDYLRSLSYAKFKTK